MTEKKTKYGVRESKVNEFLSATLKRKLKFDSKNKISRMSSPKSKTFTAKRIKNIALNASNIMFILEASQLNGQLQIALQIPENQVGGSGTGLAAETIFRGISSENIKRGLVKPKGELWVVQIVHRHTTVVLHLDTANYRALCAFLKDFMQDLDIEVHDSDEKSDSNPDRDSDSPDEPPQMVPNLVLV